MQTHKTSEILLVEDNPGDARWVELMLLEMDKGNFSVSRAENLEKARAMLVNGKYDVALLDMSLPDGEGLTILQQIKSIDPGLPIVVMTGKRDDEFALCTVQQGAQDYLVKGDIDGWQLSRVLSYSIERKRLEDEMCHLAHHDQLTGLANRTLFHDRLVQTISRAERRHEVFAVLYLDLDHFKSINDALGHNVGDALLVCVAERINQVVRDSDTVARLGGDEFAIILDDIKNGHTASIVAQKIISSMSEMLKVSEHTLYVNTSIGISIYPHCGETAELLVKNADSAMYRAKRNGRSQYSFYTHDMNARALEQLQMEAQLRHALERKEFVLHYQPKLNANTGQLTGTEALLRWQHPDKGIVYPEHFIPLLEENGLITEVGQWVITQACRQNQEWHAAGLEVGKVAVNLSGTQLLSKDFSKTIADILDETGLEPAMLEVELTENLLIKNTTVSAGILSSLKKLGVSIAIDDFGTGYCSFGYLKQFLVNTLKIDRSFVSNVTTDDTDAAIITAMIGLARDLQINVVAEGVETQSQLDYLRAHHTNEIQGYLVSPPLPPETLTNLVCEGDGFYKKLRGYPIKQTNLEQEFSHTVQ